MAKSPLSRMSSTVTHTSVVYGTQLGDGWFMHIERGCRQHGKRSSDRYKGTWLHAEVCRATRSPMGSCHPRASCCGMVQSGMVQSTMGMMARGVRVNECLHHFSLTSSADKCLFSIRQSHHHPLRGLGCKSFSSTIFRGCLQGHSCCGLIILQ